MLSIDGFYDASALMLKLKGEDFLSLTESENVQPKKETIIKVKF
jgi:hypothetical protein